MTPRGNAAAAARILTEAFPQIATFDATGMTTEQVHYFLGESAGVAFYKLQTLTGGQS